VDPKKETFLDNQNSCTIKISKRTAQTWRDEGKISFSQGNKIYYKLSDVEKANARALQQIFQREDRVKKLQRNLRVLRLQNLDETNSLNTNN
jgi:DNA-binding transcriptional regulator PaaX